MKRFFLICFFTISLISCKKETEVCYTCYDNLGNALQTNCGKNEQDAFDKSGVFMGVHTVENFRQYCKKN